MRKSTKSVAPGESSSLAVAVPEASPRTDPPRDSPLAGRDVPPPHPCLSQPPRLRQPDRQQLLPAMPLDQLIEPDHPARAVWRYIEGLDLSVWYDRIRARQGGSGRSAIEPRVLVALWLYATFTGITSARCLARLCRRHNAFRWLAGGIAVNYHTLADCRVAHAEFLEGLFQHSVEVLHAAGLVDLKRVAQDGLRVRASAGAASFRRGETLVKALQEAQAEVQRLEQQRAAVTAPPAVATEQPAATATTPAPTARQQAARKRAAEERVERIEQALERLPEMEAKKKPTEKNKARVSTTDAAATVMKMSDGGFRPAYNMQFGTTCGHQVIVGVEVVTTGSDQGQMPPMLDQIEERLAQRPKEVLVDGGFANHKDIEKVQKSGWGCKVYAPVPKPKKGEVDRHEVKAQDSEEVAEWRQRMATPEAKEIYKERAATAECVNAQARNRGLVQLLVRGLQKVKAIALWFAATHNMARSFSLLPQPVLGM